ncbi:MAG: ABC transporter substrate-binding protein [Flammeovirgaceae bacterium]
MHKQLLLLFILAGLLISCNPNQNGSEGENTGGKKIFRMNQTEELTSTDPAFANNQSNIWVTSQLYSGLFEFTEDLHEHPAIAETWNISEDGLVYTINIKKGVYFHDDKVFPNGEGREVTAEDFVYSFNRIIDPATASRGAWIFNDKVLRNADGTVSDTCFKAVNSHTLRIYLDEPFPPFLMILAMPYTYVVPKEAVQEYGRDFRSHPVGTGAFTLKQWDQGNSLILEKNQNYWDQDKDHNRLPRLDIVQVSFIPDKTQEFRAFQKGDLDFIAGVDANTIDKILKKDGTVREEIAQNFKLQKIPYLSTEYVGFQLDPKKYESSDHPILNKKVRQALSYAVNRDELVSFLRNNLGTPATNGFVPSALPSFDEGKVKGYTYDPKKANELLKEAGFPDGKGFPKLKFNSTNDYKEMAEYLQKQWSSVLGIDIEIEVNPFSAHQQMVDNGQVKLFRGAWLGDYPDEENFLSCFYGENSAPNGPNKTRYNKDLFDNTYEIVHQEKDGWKRHEMYHRLDQMVMDDCAVIVLYYDQVLRLMSKKVKNLKTSAMNDLRLDEVDMDISEVTSTN